jgi:hypothetical protein
MWKWLIHAGVQLARPVAELLLGHVVRRLARLVERLPGEKLRREKEEQDDPPAPGQSEL